MKPPKFPRVLSERGVTVKIYRAVQNRNGKDYETFTLAWHTADGRRRKLFGSFDDAMREANTVMADLVSGKAGEAGDVTTADAQLLRMARTKAEAIGKPLLAILEEYEAALKVLGGRVTILGAADAWKREHAVEIVAKPVPEIVTEFLADREKDGRSKIYLRTLRTRLGTFARQFPGAIHEVKGREIDRWVETTGKGAKDRQHMIAYARTLFNFAKQRGYLAEDRTTEAMKTRKPRVRDNKDIEIYTPDEMRAILLGNDRAGPLRRDLLPAIVLGAFAGIRPEGEIQRVDWSHIRLADRIIELKAARTKTAARRTIPISDNLAAWLQPYAGSQGPVAPIAKLTQTLRRRCRSMGVTFKKNGFRHSFGTYRTAVLKNVAEVALEMGNSPAMVMKHYREAVGPAVAAAYWAIMPPTVAA